MNNPLYTNFVMCDIYEKEQYNNCQDQSLRMPELNMILELSKNEEIYMWFLGNFLKHCIGAKNWNRAHLRQPVSKYCTPSSEALVLLIVDNSYDRWIDQLENEEKSRKNWAPAKYTNAGISQRGGVATSKRGKGWSDDGIKRFNELLKMVHEDRKSRVVFELGLQKKLKDENSVKRWNIEKVDKKIVEDIEEVVAGNDFDNDDEPGGYANFTSL
jgi:hypothetical protein